MSSKYYHRSDKEGKGTGECVVTEFPFPESMDFAGYVANESVSAYCDKSSPIGFMDGYEERYQMTTYRKLEWFTCSKEAYDNTVDQSRRIFLVPKEVEKKELVDWIQKEKYKERAVESKTPIQQAIESNYSTVKKLQEEQYHTKEGSEEYKNYDRIIWFLLSERETLKALLEQEKQFAESAYNAGECDVYERERLDEKTGGHATTPDFNQFYSQYEK